MVLIDKFVALVGVDYGSTAGIGPLVGKSNASLDRIKYYKGVVEACEFHPKNFQAILITNTSYNKVYENIFLNESIL